MSELSDLYNAKETLRKVGLPLSEEQEKKLIELEEGIIKKDIIPIVKESIEPALKDVQRELVLVVDYKPGTPISVALSRKTNITQLIDAKRLEEDPAVAHKDVGARTNKIEQKAPRTGLCIHRKDGTILQEHDAATTFVAAVKEAGVLRVRELGIKCCKINIVSTTKDSKYGNAQREVERGLYVITHSSTKYKQQLLDQINEALHLGWKIEIVQ